MVMPGGMSTRSEIAVVFRAGRRLAMIWSVASARSNWRRSAWLRSTATCLKDWISSPARCKLATSWPAAAWHAETNSSSRERVLGAVLGGTQLLLGLALGDRVVAEPLDGARHVADLVARGGAVDRTV